jgi:hypothetical protein
MSPAPGREHSMRPPIGLENIDAFYQKVAAWQAAYTSVAFHYFGVEIDGQIELWTARLFLLPGEAPKQKAIEAGNYRAGVLPLTPSCEDTRELVTKLAKGESAEIGQRRFVLPSNESASVHINVPQFLTPDGLAANKRWSVLAIEAGMAPSTTPQSEVDWLFRAAHEPHDSTGEVLVECVLGGQLPLRRRLEILAGNAVEVSRDARVEQESGTIGVWVPSTLDVAKVRLGFRIVAPLGVVKRGSLTATELRWEHGSLSNVGRADVILARGEMIQCFANYANTTHHSQWVVDPKHFQNPRIRAYSIVDEELQLLHSRILPPSGARGASARHFEWAICIALWAYGFAPALLEPSDQGTDAPDLIAIAPSGGILVVECTLGMLKAGTKLANLARRATQLRERIAAGTLVGHEVLPVFVTSLPRSEIQTELDAATDMGILVIAREGLQRAQTEMLVYWESDSLFRRGLDALRAAQADLASRRRSPQAEFPTFSG